MMYIIKVKLLDKGDVFLKRLDHVMID
jgi:hypothetical protein